MIPSILCYGPPAVELLEPRFPSFQTRTHEPQFSKQIDATAVKDVTHVAKGQVYSPKKNWWGHQTLDYCETSIETAIMDHFLRKRKEAPPPSVHAQQHAKHWRQLLPST